MLLRYGTRAFYRLNDTMDPEDETYVDDEFELVDEDVFRERRVGIDLFSLIGMF